MLLPKNSLSLLLLSAVLIISCSSPQDHANKSDLPNSPYRLPLINKEELPAISPEQQTAFDAQNTIQTSTDAKNVFYGTFPATQHQFYPADTSLSITQTQLQAALQRFVNDNCSQFSQPMRDSLAATAALAQDDYTLMLCHENLAPEIYKDGPPEKGIWVLPNILYRKDLVIKWPEEDLIFPAKP